MMVLRWMYAALVIVASAPLLATGLTLGAAVAMALLTIMLRPKATDEQKPAGREIRYEDWAPIPFDQQQSDRDLQAALDALADETGMHRVGLVDEETKE